MCVVAHSWLSDLQLQHPGSERTVLSSGVYEAVVVLCEEKPLKGCIRTMSTLPWVGPSSNHYLSWEILSLYLLFFLSAFVSCLVVLCHFFKSYKIQYQSEVWNHCSIQLNRKVCPNF